MKRFLRLLIGHIHYWGVPHIRTTDKAVVMICYECGKTREVTVSL